MEIDANTNIWRYQRTRSRFRLPGWVLAVNLAPGTILVAAICSLLSGCQTTRTGINVPPRIEFTSVPRAGADNPKELNTIEGRVVGLRAGQQIVLYAKGVTTWWVQPFADHPITTVQADSTWSNSTHPGSEYAALLVGSDFDPPLTTDRLPTKGVFASAVVRGDLPFWQKWWFLPACLIMAAPIIFAVHRLRLHQMSRKLTLRLEERLAERTRVAQELHDTLFQGVLSASMQLHVAVDSLPEDAPTRPAFDRVLQMMRQVVDEGRNTVRGLRSTNGAHDLEQLFSRIPQELNLQEEVGFRIIVEGAALPLEPGIRTEVYSIGREALVNAFRHSRASQIQMELEYASSQLRLLVRDNGGGIDPQVVQSGRDGHWGLLGMRERAERIGAKLKVASSHSDGTEVELSVPGRIAFGSNRSGRASKWLARIHGLRMEPPE
jgi:signal transduction histidine kinase